MKRPKFKFNKDLFKRSVEYNVRTMFRKRLENADKQMIFQAAALAIKDQIIDCWMDTQKAIEEEDPKVVVYLSMEFLMGRAFGNNAINLQGYKAVKEALEELGFDVNAVEDEEPDPALGNGGLGRLAACFLDSLATLNYPAYGCGIRYRYGMFKQQIRDGYQVEVPDNWLANGNPFELRRPEYTQIIRFGGHVVSHYDAATDRTIFTQEDCHEVKAIPYDMPVVGYGNGFVDTLRIWDAEPMELFHLDSFDKGDYQKAVEQDNIARTICEVLYPCDDHTQGKELRLKQQYFFVSASMQASIKKYLQNPKHNIRKYYEKRVFQMNDTHPTLAVPELMRILMDEQGLSWDEAWNITTKSLAYTNHTIMAEALEKWPAEMFQKLLPRIYQIVEEINRRFEIEVRERYAAEGEQVVNDKVRSMAILYDKQVRMANLAIVAAFSVNGVARLHTEILKKRELHDFYEFFPKKFNNKTNGVTQRRFLLHGNPLLAEYVSGKVGKEWITDLSRMEGLKSLADDKKAQKQVMEIKRKNKERLAAYILEHNGIVVNPDSIFDVQVKRLHEYKRQLLKVLHIMHLYNALRENPDMPFTPHTYIFGAKAAAGYKNAKLTIKLINAVADVVNNDPAVKDKLCVVFIEDYRVSNAEIIFAAADISEQISTASREASGTSNMKLMLNGAITMGTMDGANVEIVEEVGAENAFIFGLSSEEVMAYEKNGGYDPVQLYEQDGRIHRVLDQLVDGTYAPDNHELFRPLRESLLQATGGGPADRYFILKDFAAYNDAQQAADEAYRDPARWAKMSILNMASVGKFSSDRTIKEYAEQIWKLKPLEL